MCYNVKRMCIKSSSLRRGVGGEAVCRALPHFHKHLFSFRYCLRHHFNECEHAAGRVEHISFASVEAKEDASSCVFWLIPRMNPYPLKPLHIHQQRQPSSEPSAACDENAITPCGDSPKALAFHFLNRFQ